MQSHRTALLVVCVASPLAVAQTATVEVSHDALSGVVLPGETIRITANIAWEGAPQWAGLKGGFIASGDAGAASNIGTPPALRPGTLVTLGSPVGGSVKGFDVATISCVFTGGIVPPLPWSAGPLGADFLWYDWTAPTVATPTAISFDFIADPIAPNVRLYTCQYHPIFLEADTTYIGTSILVIPAPVGLPILALAALAPRRRR